MNQHEDFDLVLQRLAALERTNARLEAEIAALRGGGAAPSPFLGRSGRSEARGRPTSTRRGLLRTAVGAAAGLAAAGGVTAFRPGERAGAASQPVRTEATVIATKPTAIVSQQPYVGGNYGFAVTDYGLNALPNTIAAAVVAHAKQGFNTALLAFAQNPLRRAVVAISEDYEAVNAGSHKGVGVVGTSTYSVGVVATSFAGTALQAEALLPDNALAALQAVTRGSGPAVEARSKAGPGVNAGAQSGAGVYATSVSGFGVWGNLNAPENDLAAVIGTTIGAGEGVRGESERGIGVAAASDANMAIRGDIRVPLNSLPAILGRTVGSGPGVRGESKQGPGVHGKSEAGVGVRGEIAAANPSAAVHGATGGSGPALLGESAGGRGAVLAGKVAQLQLKPSASTTHPPTGVRGDFFVDKAAHLWYCRGGAAWKQLA